MDVVCRARAVVSCCCLALVALLGLPGCGGGGGGGATPPPGAPELGRAVTIAVHWPQPEGRVIPNSADVVAIHLVGNGLDLVDDPIYRGDVQGGQATRTLTGMPAGHYDVNVTAAAEDGTIVATGTSPVDVPESGTVSAMVTLSHTAEGSPAVLAQGSATGWTGLAVDFSGSASDHGGSIVSYRWDFGDGSEPATSPDTAAVSHVFTQPGAYDVTLTATDNDGLTDSATVTITVAQTRVEFLRFISSEGDEVPSTAVQGYVFMEVRVHAPGVVRSVDVIQIDETSEWRKAQCTDLGDGLWRGAYGTYALGERSVRIEADTVLYGKLSVIHTFTIVDGGQPFGGRAVAVTPSQIVLAPGAQQRFAASLRVLWSVIEPGGGTINGLGLYTAPETPGSYTILATDQYWSANAARVPVTVLPPAESDLIVNPVTCIVRAGETQLFAVSSNLATPPAVTWSATGGTINEYGLYAAPAAAGLFAVTATSQADPGRSETVTVAVCQAGPGPDGGEMIQIPAGQFYFGRRNSAFGSHAPYPEDDVMPIREIHLDTYAIHTTEVTNARYAAFLNAVRPSPAVLETWLKFEPTPQYTQEIQITGGGYQPLAGTADHPVLLVTWLGAQAYASHYGLLLPSEAQWEKAARGAFDERQFPWGLVGDLAWHDTPEEGASPWGVQNMLNGVEEWCRDWDDRQWHDTMPAANPVNTTTDTYRSTRDIGWMLTDRSGSTPEVVYFKRGFRCVAEP